MASLTKTIQTALFTTQSLASNSVAISSELAVATHLSAHVFIQFGRRSASALTQALEFRLEGSSTASGDGFWHVISGATFLTNIAAVGSEAVSGTCNSGQKVIAMASTTGFTVGTSVFIDNGTIANSEWGRIAVVTTNTSITLEDNLTNAQTGSTVYADAQIYPAMLVNLDGVKRLRLVANGCNTGQAVAIQAGIITADSIG